MECCHLELFFVGLLHSNSGWKMKHAIWQEWRTWVENNAVLEGHCCSASDVEGTSRMRKIKGVGSVCFYVWHTSTTLKNCSCMRKLKKNKTWNHSKCLNKSKHVQCKGGQNCTQIHGPKALNWTSSSHQVNWGTTAPGHHEAWSCCDGLFLTPSPANSF